MGLLRWYCSLADEVSDRDVTRAAGLNETSLDALVDERSSATGDYQFIEDAMSDRLMLSDQTDPGSLTPQEQTARDEFQVTVLHALRQIQPDTREG